MKIKMKRNIILAISAITTTTMVAAIAAACSVNAKYELKPYNASFVLYENDKTFIKMQTNLEEDVLKNLVFSIAVNETKLATKAVDIKKENNNYTFKLEISKLDKSKDNVIVISDNKKNFNTTTVTVKAKDVKDMDSSSQDQGSSTTNPSNENSGSSEATKPDTGAESGSDNPPKNPPVNGSQDQGNASGAGNTDTSTNKPAGSDTSGETVKPNPDTSSTQNPPVNGSGSQDQGTGSNSGNSESTNTAGSDSSAQDTSTQNPPATDAPNKEETPDVNTQTPPTPERQKLVISMETDEGYLKEENSGNPSPDKKSPAISWNQVEGAASYAVVMIDYDASVVTQSMPFVHWMVANIKTTNLASLPITQKHDGTITGSTFIQSQTGSTGQQQIFYYPTTPPNGIHNYEIKVFALSKEIDSASVVEVNNQVTYNKVEKAIFDAGVIDYDVKYVLGRQIDQNRELLPKEDSTTNRLFKDDQKTFIDQIDLTNLNNFKVTLTQNQDASLYTQDPAFTFNDTNANAKSYLVMLTSTNSTQNLGVDQGTIHYAAIVSKDKTKKHIFNNAYGSNFYIDKYQNIKKNNVPIITQIAGNKMAILENEQSANSGVYTITIMGIDEEFDTLLTNVNNVKNKYAAMFGAREDSNLDEFNTVTNALESIRNKVVSYGTTYKN